MNKHINNFTEQKHSKLRNMEKHKPKEYWKFLNSLKRKPAPESPDIQEFYDHFKSIYGDIQIDEENEDDYSNPEPFENASEFLNQPFTQHEIDKCIRKLKNSKSPGLDCNLNEYIKLTKNEMLPVYEALFNIILETGIIPEEWTIGKIKPIYKNKGDTTDPNNYRPITLLSCLGKLFTFLLSERLSAFVEENQILQENQAGFRHGYSTSDHIFALHALVELMRYEKKKLFCSFIDFSKAFDSVWRVGLWRKLLNNDINGNFFQIIHNMYQNIKSCVADKGEYSAFFMSNCGVRQGDNLSPILFSMILNDLEDHLINDRSDGIEIECYNDQMYVFMEVFILLYADDTVILADNAQSFQNCLDSFHRYCKTWKLTINTDKSKVIIFGSRKTKAFNFKLGNTKLEIVNSYKYLGTFFAPSGSFLITRKHIASQANKAMHLLNMRTNNLNLPVDLQLKLFDNTVLPILTYSAEVWGFESCKILEPIHNQFLRSITKARKSTPMYMIYAELGRYPLELTIKCRMISFWTRIVLGKQNKLSNILYQKLLNTPGINSKWVQNIKEILQNCGRCDIWQNPRQSRNIAAIIKRNLVDQFTQNWRTSLENSSKGRNYYLFKETPNFEQYFVNLPKSMYINFAKFRTANHSFPCETGRYNDTELAERKCMLCDKNSIGDEMHYLLECPFFHNDRVKYINKFYYTRINVLKFKDLMCSSNIYTLKRLCQFIAILLKTVK